MILQILIWQVAAILFAEFVLFFAGFGEEEILKLDPELGTKHMTSKRVTWRSEGFAQSYLNSDGLRSEEVSVEKPAGVYRVALLGDSLTESLQVTLEQTFGRLLQNDWNASGRKVQVLNFGTSGYSTAQEYLQLKSQVLKYQPDVVMVGYNSRDLFENWSPPDQVLTNVRPVAVKPPGGKLVVDSSPVKHWMRSARARFLARIEWLRENSRLCGMLSAVERDWSLHNPTGSWLNSLTAMFKTKASPVVVAATAPKVESSEPAKPAAIPTVTSPTPPIVHDPPEMLTSTLGELFVEMKKECASKGAKFVVVALPVRSALAPDSSIEGDFNGVTYEDEVRTLKTVCAARDIAFLNCESAAETLSSTDRRNLFYAVHYSPEGHKLVAQQFRQYFDEQIHP